VKREMKEEEHLLSVDPPISLVSIACHNQILLLKASAISSLLLRKTGNEITEHNPSEISDLLNIVYDIMLHAWFIHAADPLSFFC
jgi:hypothetical protein